MYKWIKCFPRYWQNKDINQRNSPKKVQMAVQLNFIMLAASMPLKSIGKLSNGKQHLISIVNSSSNWPKTGENPGKLLPCSGSLLNVGTNFCPKSFKHRHIRPKSGGSMPTCVGWCNIRKWQHHQSHKVDNSKAFENICCISQF